MENINSLISENLKRLREQKKMSLDAVSKLSGVSKSMLGQIERGEVNPTISTVWKIANGLKITVSDLASRPETECDIIEKEAIQPLLEDDGHYRNYIVFPFDGSRRFEMLFIEIDQGSHMEAEPHPNGAQELITVFSGELVIRLSDETFTVKKFNSIRFKADQIHQYQNISDEICRLSMLIYYPA